jgi:hypothetical protein
VSARPPAASVLAAILRADGRDPAVGRLTPALIEAAVWHGVAPLVYDAVRRNGALAAVPPPARVALERVAREALVVEAVRHAELQRLLAELGRSGIRPLLFKGAALAHIHYPAPWLRTRGDTDLLVDAAQVSTVEAALKRLGFARVARPDGITFQARYEALRTGVAIAYDVHWRIADPLAFGAFLAGPDLAAGAVPLPGLDADAPGLVHALLVACVHRIAHHHDTPSLILLYDIDLLARACSPVDWDRLAAEAEVRQLCAVSRRSLEQARALLGTPVPDSIVRRLAKADGEPSAGFLRPGLTRAAVVWSDLRALGSWGERATLVRQHLLPSPAYLMSAYGCRRPLLLPALYVHRILAGVGGWFRDLLPRLHEKEEPSCPVTRMASTARSASALTSSAVCSTEKPCSSTSRPAPTSG